MTSENFETYIVNLTIRNREGFWFSVQQPNYPMPIPNQLSDSEAKDIYDLIRIKENECSDPEHKNDFIFVSLYRGMSSSRITGELLGCAEYNHSDWVWPGDFAEHYVLKHKVKPSNEFLKFIGYENSN